MNQNYIPKDLKCLVCKGNNLRYMETYIHGLKPKVYAYYCYDCDMVSMGIDI